MLLSKLRLPETKTKTLRRKRLQNLISCNLDKKIILMCAGAGYGKTTLLSHLLSYGEIQYVYYHNLPTDCAIWIYNLNGELVRMIRHAATSEGGVMGDLGGDEWWDLLSDNRQLVASGVYIFHVQSQVGEQVGKFVVVH